MLNPEMRDVMDNHICIHPLVRHTLRLTCKTLHSWIPVDEKFVHMLGMLSGRILDAEKDVTTQSIVMLTLLVSKSFEFRSMDVKFMYGKVLVTNIKTISIKGIKCYGFDFEYFPEALLGHIPSMVVDNVICTYVGKDNDPMRTIFNIVGEEYFKLLYHWKLSFDSAYKIILLERSK